MPKSAPTEKPLVDPAEGPVGQFSRDFDNREIVVVVVAVDAVHAEVEGCPNPSLLVCLATVFWRYRLTISCSVFGDGLSSRIRATALTEATSQL